MNARHGVILCAGVAGYCTIHRVAAPRWDGFWRDQASDVLAGIALPAIVALIASPAVPLGAWLRTAKTRIALIVGAALVWEGVMPLVRRGSVADPLDVVAYLAGTLLYLAASHLWHHGWRRHSARRSVSASRSPFAPPRPTRASPRDRVRGRD